MRLYFSSDEYAIIMLYFNNFRRRALPNEFSIYDHFTQISTTRVLSIFWSFGLKLTKKSCDTLEFLQNVLWDYGTSVKSCGLSD
jgi:hypothetical protein